MRVSVGVSKIIDDYEVSAYSAGDSAPFSVRVAFQQDSFAVEGYSATSSAFFEGLNQR